MLLLGKPIYFVDSGKWKNIKWYFDNVGFGQYDYFWFPDPDLEIDIRTVNELFRYVRENGFDLCQPSLTLGSHNSHEFHKQVEDSTVRKVPFVEIMCPCFSRKALVELLWTFDLSYSGYGLDALWAKYFDCFVIDLFAVRHSRPPSFAARAAKRGFPDPNDEFREIWERFELEGVVDYDFRI